MGYEEGFEMDGDCRGGGIFIDCVCGAGGVAASQASRILRSQRLYGHAREFREIGLTTLMPDLRGHGDSDGDRICLAYNETADIKAVTEYVKATYTDIPVIVMGLSMGGGVAIRSIGENDDIDALITMSASAGVCQECCG